MDVLRGYVSVLVQTTPSKEGEKIGREQAESESLLQRGKRPGGREGLR